jgi:hypothetical protein
MAESGFDIAPFLLTDDDSFPYPDWSQVAAAISERVGTADKRAVWTGVARQWLTTAATQVSGYEVRETKHFLLLLPSDSGFSDMLAADAEYSRQSILELLPGVTRFEPPGKQVVIVFPKLDDYYTYTAAFHPDRGEYGTSTGMFMRGAGYPHTVFYLSTTGHHLTPTLAHELTHEALNHLALPLWLEEGATQCVEQSVTPGGGFHLSAERVRRHKRYWSRYGLGALWWGRGYHRPGRVQGLCYELSNIFFHLLSEEFRPSWFGLFGNGRRERLLSFFREANELDAGVSAAQEYLGMTLGQLAEKFLGPGDWSPRIEDREKVKADKHDTDDGSEEVGEV